ncbi:MAG: LamG-like jellyroll fold domain-containing protein [Pirellulales bacterium]
MKCAKLCVAVVLTLSILGTRHEAHAAIKSSGSGATLHYGYHTGPGGGLDADTLHYWNFDEGAVTYADTGMVSPSTNLIPMTAQSGTAAVDSILFSAGGAANSAVRIGTTATSANRVTAFTAVSGINDDITADQANSLYGSSGAITIDMLLRPDFDQTTHAGSTFRLITEENEEVNPVNIFLGYNTQTDIVPTDAHVIEFRMGDGGVATQVQAVVPFSGPNAMANGSWYHLAVIYTGDETATDNVKFYWTKVSGPTDATAVANPIGTATLTADPVFLTSGPEFTIGNETNGGSNKPWFGALDEIRISGVDRDPSGAGAGFIFEPGGFLHEAYNQNGTVDAADYVLWRKDPASYDGDPVGYDNWRAHFGESSGGGAALLAGSSLSAVPEPTTCVFLLMAAAAVGVLPSICRWKKP